MNASSLGRRGPTGIGRLDPRPARWSALDLARRRSMTIARAELQASEARGDPAVIVAAWRDVVETMTSAEFGRRPAPLPRPVRRVLRVAGGPRHRDQPMSGFVGLLPRIRLG